MVSNNKNLAEKIYWESIYIDYKFKPLGKEDIIYKWIQGFFHVDEDNKNKTCFEVGVFPGTYLSIFGELGYKLNGIDQIDLVETALPKWFENQKYLVGNFFQGDFLNWKSDEKYDIVISFGFIEHFKNFEEIIALQCELVKPGGYIVIETPNFRGFFQRWIRFFIDKKNLDRHYIPSMNLDKWEKVLHEKKFKIINKTYLGNFSIWVENQKRNAFQKLILKVLKFFNSFLSKNLPKNNKHFSPYLGIIAIKT